MKETCTICCEEMTKYQTCLCIFCNFSCCKTCFKRYTIEKEAEASCMGCGTIFSIEHLETMVTKKWINEDYKVMKTNLLMDREKSMLPEAQIAVQAEITKRENIEIRNKINEEKQKLYQKIKEMDEQIVMVNNTIAGNLGAVSNNPVGFPVFTFKCGKDECKGFLDKGNKCGTCSSVFCKECNELLTEGHECKQEDVETTKMLKKDTKPCPGCGTLIFKISGCNQMWCTGCKTAFDWKTGRIETNHIHNPHYYEFMRNNNIVERQPGDEVCGGIPRLNVLKQNFLDVTFGCHRQTVFPLRHSTSMERYLTQDSKELLNSVMDIHRIVMHINRAELRYRYRTDRNMDNLDLRVRYLMNELEESEWKKELQSRERWSTICRDMYGIFSMIDEVGTHMLLKEFKTVQDFKDLVVQFENLIDVTNKDCRKIGLRHKIKPRKITCNEMKRFEII